MDWMIPLFVCFFIRIHQSVAGHVQASSSCPPLCPTWTRGLCTQQVFCRAVALTVILYPCRQLEWWEQIWGLPP